MSNAFEPVLYGLVRKIWQEHKENRQEPCVAKSTEIYVEVRALLDEALERMVADNILVKTHNINGIQMYSIGRPLKSEAPKKKRR